MRGEKLGLVWGHGRVQNQVWLWPTQHGSLHSSLFRTVIISCKKSWNIYALILISDWSKSKPKGIEIQMLPVLATWGQPTHKDADPDHWHESVQQPEHTNTQVMGGNMVEPCLPSSPLKSRWASTIHSTNPPGGGRSQFLEERSFKRGANSPHPPPLVFRLTWFSSPSTLWTRFSSP